MSAKKYRFSPNFLCLGIAIFSILPSLSLAQSTSSLPMGRYLTIETKPQLDQVDLLSTMIQVHFLSDISTVGDAINNVLRYSGYSLVEVKQQDLDLQNTLKKPLPLVDRDLGPISLRQALTILAGPAFHLVTNSLNRTINFRIKPEFLHINN